MWVWVSLSIPDTTLDPGGQRFTQNCSLQLQPSPFSSCLLCLQQEAPLRASGSTFIPRSTVRGSAAPLAQPCPPFAPDADAPLPKGKMGHTGYTKQSGITSKASVGCFSRDLLHHQGVLEQDTDLGLKAAPSATSQNPLMAAPFHALTGVLKNALLFGRMCSVTDR